MERCGPSSRKNFLWLKLRALIRRFSSAAPQEKSYSSPSASPVLRATSFMGSPLRAVCSAIAANDFRVAWTPFLRTSAIQDGTNATKNWRSPLCGGVICSATEHHGLAASSVAGSLQLACAEAPLHKPGRVAAPAGKACGGSFCALPTRLRLWNYSHNLLGGRRK